MSLMTGVDLPMASSGFSEHPSGRELKKSFRYTKLKNSEWFANQVGLVDAVC